MVLAGLTRIERVAVGRGLGDQFGADIVAGAGLVLDDELLAELLAQPISDNARDDVGRSAGRIADDDAHRVVGIAGRPRVGGCDQRQAKQTKQQTRKKSDVASHRRDPPKPAGTSWPHRF